MLKLSSISGKAKGHVLLNSRRIYKINVRQRVHYGNSISKAKEASISSEAIKKQYVGGS